MTAGFHLTISTPSRVLFDADDIVSLRAEDESGGFGLLAGHADIVASLPSSVVSWRQDGATWRYAVVSGAVLTMSGGRRAAIACRSGLVGDELETLREEVRARRAAELDADRRARVEQVRLHARAVRQLMLLLGTASGSGPPGGPQGAP